MDEKQSHLLRRVFHLLSPVFLIYYLLPEDFWGIMPRFYLTLMSVAFMAFIEVVRLNDDKHWPGFREYEFHRVSALMWASIGLGISFAFFPMKFVIPALCGLAWIDPLIGEMKRKKIKGYPFIPGLVYIVIWLVMLSLLSDFSTFKIFFLSGMAMVIALVVEYPSHKYIDDDFIMLVIPAGIIYVLDLVMI